MSIIGWIVFGALVGWIASSIMGTKGGCLGNVLLGICGSVIGGFLFSLLGGAPVTGFNLWSIIVGVIGSVLIVVGVRAAQKT